MVSFRVGTPEGVSAFEITFAVSFSRSTRVSPSFDTPVNHRKIQRAVAVEIGKQRPKTGAASSQIAEAGGGCLILKQSHWALFPETMLLPRQMSNENFEQAIGIDVSTRD